MADIWIVQREADGAIAGVRGNRRSANTLIGEVENENSTYRALPFDIVDPKLVVAEPSEPVIVEVPVEKIVYADPTATFENSDNLAAALENVLSMLTKANAPKQILDAVGNVVNPALETYEVAKSSAASAPIQDVPTETEGEALGEGSTQSERSADIEVDEIQEDTVPFSSEDIVAATQSADPEASEELDFLMGVDAPSLEDKAESTEVAIVDDEKVTTEPETSEDAPTIAVEPEAVVTELPFTEPELAAAVASEQAQNAEPTASSQEEDDVDDIVDTPAPPVSAFRHPNRDGLDNFIDETSDIAPLTSVAASLNSWLEEDGEVIEEDSPADTPSVSNADVLI